ncbi:hypothetical protein U1Q18_006044 [Sarracenia purpurea var. burkii]
MAGGRRGPIVQTERLMYFLRISKPREIDEVENDETDKNQENPGPSSGTGVRDLDEDNGYVEGEENFI